MKIEHIKVLIGLVALALSALAVPISIFSVDFCDNFFGKALQ